MGRCILKDIISLFENVVNSLNNEIAINSIGDVTDGKSAISVSCLKWLRAASGLNSQVDISGVVYEVVEIVDIQTIKVKTNIKPIGKVLKITRPLFLNATMLKALSERESILDNTGKLRKDSWQKLPFIWLLEPFNTNEDKDIRAMVESSPDVVFLFLDGASPNDWSTKQHYSNVINPIDSLVDAFVNYIVSNKKDFGSISNFRKVRHANFGEQFKQGHLQSILNEKLSGIEVRFSVEVRKDLKCNNCN